MLDGVVDDNNNNRTRNAVYKITLTSKTATQFSALNKMFEFECVFLVSSISHFTHSVSERTKKITYTHIYRSHSLSVIDFCNFVILLRKNNITSTTSTIHKEYSINAWITNIYQSKNPFSQLKSHFPHGIAFFFFFRIFDATSQTLDTLFFFFYIVSLGFFPSLSLIANYSNMRNAHVIAKQFLIATNPWAFNLIHFIFVINIYVYINFFLWIFIRWKFNG